MAKQPSSKAIDFHNGARLISTSPEKGRHRLNVETRFTDDGIDALLKALGAEWNATKTAPLHRWGRRFSADFDFGADLWTIEFITSLNEHENRTFIEALQSIDSDDIIEADEEEYIGDDDEDEDDFWGEVEEDDEDDFWDDVEEDMDEEEEEDEKPTSEEDFSDLPEQAEETDPTHYELDEWRTVLKAAGLKQAGPNRMQYAGQGPLMGFSVHLQAGGPEEQNFYLAKLKQTKPNGDRISIGNPFMNFKSLQSFFENIVDGYKSLSDEDIQKALKEAIEDIRNLHHERKKGARGMSKWLAETEDKKAEKESNPNPTAAGGVLVDRLNMETIDGIPYISVHTEHLRRGVSVFRKAGFELYPAMWLYPISGAWEADKLFKRLRGDGLEVTNKTEAKRLLRGRRSISIPSQQRKELRAEMIQGREDMEFKAHVLNWNGLKTIAFVHRANNRLSQKLFWKLRMQHHLGGWLKPTRTKKEVDAAISALNSAGLRVSRWADFVEDYKAAFGSSNRPIESLVYRPVMR